jgi:uncharacterized membrane protein
MADLTTKATKKAIEVAGKANPANGEGPASNPKGLAAAGLVLAAVPLVAEKLAKGVGPKVSDKVGDATDQAKEQAKTQVKEAADEVTPDMPKALKGGGFLSGLFGGSDSDENGAGKGSAAPGFGSGRRMPIQQSVDVAVPVRQAYDAWTRFEDWPDFMHRLESAQQIDDATVAFQAKIWGIKKRFEADILEQRPDQRIEWDVTQGYAHTGVVTFHKLSDRLTRVEVTLDIEPDSLLEKASRGMRFVKRAVRGDLHRFKAYVELEEESEGGWRGRIEDGRVKRRPSSNGSSSRKGSGSRRKSGGSSPPKQGSKS